jgi:cytoskeletal protein CcmA (bactofilin family)
MPNETTGTIGRGIIIRGRLEGSEELTIEGRVEGTISLKNHLTIESSGVVIADIEAENLTIKGELQGNVNTLEKVAINANAKVIGNLKAPRVIIEDGAHFKGSIEMEFEVPE